MVKNKKQEMVDSKKITALHDQLKIDIGQIRPFGTSPKSYKKLRKAQQLIAEVINNY